MIPIQRFIPVWLRDIILKAEQVLLVAIPRSIWPTWCYWLRRTQPFTRSHFACLPVVWCMVIQTKITITSQQNITVNSTALSRQKSRHWSITIVKMRPMRIWRRTKSPLQIILFSVYWIIIPILESIISRQSWKCYNWKGVISLTSAILLMMLV